MIKILKLSVLSLALALAGGCSNLFTVHKIDIQQGNALTVEQLVEIREGMSRSELLERVGPPILEPTFNDERWDYVYYLKQADQTAQRKTVSVFFSANKVSRIERNDS